MTKRSIEEIEKDIQECSKEFHETYKDSWYFHKGVFRWKSYEVVDELNKMSHHIANLKLELNNARMRDFGMEVRLKRRREENV